MSTESLDPGHGHSPAAWTAVVIVLIAFAAGTLFFVLGWIWYVVGSAILAVIGFIVGWVMKLLGYGVGGAKSKTQVH